MLQDGTEVRSKLVLSNASPQITFLELVPQVWSAWGWWGLGMLESLCSHCLSYPASALVYPTPGAAAKGFCPADPTG